jgi:hypothetical protein
LINRHRVGLFTIFISIVITSLPVFGQEVLKPYRVFGIVGTIGGGYGVGFEYAFNAGSSITLGSELNVLLSSDSNFSNIEANGIFKIYPFSNLGKGFFSGIDFNYSNTNSFKNNQNINTIEEGIGIDIGWKWLIFKSIILDADINCEYMFNTAQDSQQINGHIEIALGYAF